MLLHQGRPDAWSRWAELADAALPSARQIIRLDSMFALARAAERGAGIALIPMPMSQTWFQNGSLLRLFSQDLVSPESYFVVSSGDGEHPEANDTLFRWIVDRFAEPDQVAAAACKAA